MNKSVIYIVGATVLLGGAYLFLKNKKAKDLSKLAEIGGTTSGGTTLSLSTTSDGVSPSDANINLANATFLANEIKAMDKERNTFFSGQKRVGGMFSNETPEYRAYNYMVATYEIRRQPKVLELAKLGYKIDPITKKLVKI